MCSSKNSSSGRGALSVLLAMALNVAGNVPLLAQSGGSFQITNSVVAAGGGESKDATNNRFNHESTVGEHAAGTLLRNPPYSQTAGLWASNVGLTPTASPASIRGRILTSDGVPIAGVTINLRGNSGGSPTLRAITDASGAYSFADLEIGGFYTVTPSRANYSFSPQALTFSLLADKTDAVFTALPAVVTANPLDTPQFFVRQQYLDFLNREPDQTGLEYWTTQIENCGSDQQCLNSRRIGVSAAYFIETEFQQSGSFVYRLYKGALGRQITYAEFNADRSQVIGGDTLEQSKAAFADSFVRRPEFIGNYRNATTAEAFVLTLIQTVQQSTGIDLSDQRDALIASYNSASEVNESRSLVVRGAIERAAFKQAVYNSSFVLMQYFGYLHRNPDQAGYAFWLRVLDNTEPQSYRGMVCAFTTSTEYQQRFGLVVTHSNAECPQ